MPTRVEEAIDRFTDVSSRAAIQETALPAFRKAIKQINHINPYSQSAKSAKILEELGIGSSPFSAVGHPHAADKAIENELLATVGARLPKEPCTFLYIKPSKLRFMNRGPQQKDVIINMRHEPKDVGRYDEETLRAKVGTIHTKVAYISDAMHFMSFRQVLKIFRDSPCMETMYATVVLPPEVFHRHPSLYPDIYKLNYDMGAFQYLPGGHGGGAYFHEMESMEWLRVRSLNGGGLCVTVQKEETKGAHHLLCLTRGRLLSPPWNTFTHNDMAMIPRIFAPPELNSQRPYKLIWLNQMTLYVKSVKMVKANDISGKVRQLIKTEGLEHFVPAELAHIVSFFEFMSELQTKNDYPTLIGAGWFTRLARPVQARLRDYWERVCGASDFRKFLKLLEFEPFTYGQPTRHIRLNALEMEFTPPPHDDVVVEAPAGLDLRALVHEDVGGPEWEEKIAEDARDIAAEWEKKRKLARDQAGKQKERGPASERDGSEEVASEAGVSAQGERDEVMGVDPEVEADPLSAWRAVLTACGFPHIQPQAVHGQVLMPIERIKEVHWPEAYVGDDMPTDLVRRCLEVCRPMGRKAYHRTYRSRRAAAYSSDVKNERIGALLKAQRREWKDSFNAVCEAAEVTVPTIVFHGAGGSGKSHALQMWIKTLGPEMDNVKVIVPSVELMLDWEEKLVRAPKTMISTYEKAETQAGKTIVIIDDHGKLPAGAAEAYLAKRPYVELVIFTGDFKQSVHHEKNPEAKIAQLHSSVDEMDDCCTYYLNATHRNALRFANALGVCGERDIPVHVSLDTHKVEGIPCLVPGTVKKAAYRDMGNLAYTYAGCQGLTVKAINMVLDRDTPLCAERVMYTALSRAVDEIHFINTGSDRDEFWAKLEATPYLKAFLHLLREEEPAEEEVYDEEPREAEPPRTHLPVDPASDILEELADEAGDKFEREIWVEGHGPTNAIQTEDRIVQLFPHQQAKDDALLWETIAVRLGFATAAENERELLDNMDIGDILFHNYARAMCLPQDQMAFNRELWEACEAEVTAKYLEKNVAQLINGAARQDPDFDAEAISLFLKSQWVKKVEKLGQPVKAGQTIASFMQSTVMLYGTMARYLRRIREEYQPANIFINCEKTPAQMDRFVQEHWSFDQPAYANDFKNFDGTQTGATLAFEVLKARHCGVPEEVVSGYIWIKCNAKVFLGTLAIMRLSGEGPTFDANTECAIAYDHTRFHIPVDCAAMYGGDDSLRARVCPEKPSFSELSSRVPMVSKPVVYSQQQGDYGEFCAWSVTPLSIIKSPLKLYSSLMLGLKRGQVDRLIRSYSADIDYTYRLGDGVYSILGEEQMRLHWSALRILVLHGYKPPESVGHRPEASEAWEELGDLVPGTRRWLTKVAELSRMKRDRVVEVYRTNLDAAREGRLARPDYAAANSTLAFAFGALGRQPKEADVMAIDRYRRYVKAKALTPAWYDEVARYVGCAPAAMASLVHHLRRDVSIPHAPEQLAEVAFTLAIHTWAPGLSLPVELVRAWNTSSSS